MARHRNPLAAAGGSSKDPNEVWRKAQEAQRAGQWAQAEKLYRAALKAGGARPAPLREHARMLSKLGRHLEALKSIDRARKLQPDDLDLLVVRATILRAAGRPEDAVAACRKVLAKRPRPSAADHYQLGLALRDAGDHGAAAASFEAALEHAPDQLQARHGLASCLYRRGALREAADQLERCLEQEPTSLPCLMTASAVARARGRYTEAVELVQRALAKRPDLLVGHSNLGQLLRELGHIDEAVEHFRQAIALDPDAITPRIQLVSARRYTTRDADVAWIEKAVEKPRHRGGELADLQFARSKLCRDLGDDEAAFRWLHRANATRRQTFEYPVDEDLARLERLQDRFDDATLARAAAAGGCPDPTPIVVCGMPRSGTTLVEQILASHPEIHGAGERTALQDLCEQTPELRGERTPLGVPDAPAEVLADVGARYVERLRDHGEHPGRPAHVVDKMPMNALLVGALRFLLPAARIVCLRRDPRDTCLSLYRTNFQGGVPYSYDLEELGRYHLQHDRLLDHWAAHVGEDRLLEVRYEDLVTDLEGQTRRLCAFLDLPYDAGMLRFHEAGRAVITASLDQIREPVHDRSVGGWKRHEQHLGPLLELFP